MPRRPNESVTTPRRDELDLVTIVNRTGLSVSLLPTGAVFAIEHERDGRRILVNQVLGSPVAGGMGQMFIRVGDAQASLVAVAGAQAQGRIGHADDRFVWEGTGAGLHWRTILWLHASSNVWLWRVEVVNRRDVETACDAIFIQDLGLGEQGFLMGNEAYASQYLDHFIAHHPRLNSVLMTRQNLAQGEAHPWISHGCLEGAAGFATDYRELMGPAHRDGDRFALPFGAPLSSERLQYETGCAGLQSKAVTIAPGSTAIWTFFAAYQPDHPTASSEADLSVVAEVERAHDAFKSRRVALHSPVRSFALDAPVAVALPMEPQEIKRRYPRRLHAERRGGRALSFFTPAKSHNRHVVLRDKERIVWRRHGALLRSGAEMLPSETLLCATCWMHGVFGAQLTIGNTSFHKLFSVSRDPYNIMRASGLRMLVDWGDGWRHLAVPSAFEMGLSDCRWIYRFQDRVVVVSAIVAAGEPAMRWRIDVEGEACRFLIFGHLVLGELELGHAARMEIDWVRKQFIFRPDPSDGLWGARYPRAQYRLVTSEPEHIEAIGADELLYVDGKRRSGAYAVVRTRRTKSFDFAVVGALAGEAEALATKYAGRVETSAMLTEGDRCWRGITRGVRIDDAKGDAKAVNTILPWLVHDAMIHLTVPHGLEQYTGAAWGVRDVCQGPLELLLALEHDATAKEIVRKIFAQQYQSRGDWPQWFMLEPYSAIQDKEAHGDVVVWPLKAVCDYIEATGDLAFLDERVAWRRDDNFEPTAQLDPVRAHIAKLIAVVRERFIPGTCLIRYGNGDWNDSLQPVDPGMRDWLASSWTVALLYEQLRRYAGILRMAHLVGEADGLDALASRMNEDFHRFLVHDGIVSGYGLFRPEGGLAELLIHPSDTRTGLSYSLIPMTQAIIGGLFTPEETVRHRTIIRENLLFPDGARLMEKSLPYRGGVQTTFRRAESAAFFGREIGLMYTHSHLRYAESMSLLGEPEALWEALLVANPIAVTERVRHASLRQRNAYFSSSDAAFRDRYFASSEWEQAKTGAIPADGGWRVYSSGPGLYLHILIQRAFGLRRRHGKRFEAPCMPNSQAGLSLTFEGRAATDPSGA
jgi:1,2-beta-oligoglucan phosphorylase